MICNSTDANLYSQELASRVDTCREHAPVKMIHREEAMAFLSERYFVEFHGEKVYRDPRLHLFVLPRGQKGQWFDSFSEALSYFLGICDAYKVKHGL